MSTASGEADGRSAQGSFELPEKGEWRAAAKATRGRGKHAWRLEPEGETEMLETKVVSDVVDGVPCLLGAADGGAFGGCPKTVVELVVSSGEAGSPRPGAKGTPSAVDAAVEMPADEARPGVAKQSATHHSVLR